MTLGFVTKNLVLPLFWDRISSDSKEYGWSSERRRQSPTDCPNDRYCEVETFSVGLSQKWSVKDISRDLCCFTYVGKRTGTCVYFYFMLQELLPFFTDSLLLTFIFRYELTFDFCKCIGLSLSLTQWLKPHAINL